MMSLGVLMILIGHAWQAWVDAGGGDESTSGAMIASTGIVLVVASFAIYAWRIFP